MKKKPRVQKQCAVCSSTFEVKASLVHAYATCSKDCSLKYRSLNSTGRKMTWGDKIKEAKARNNKPHDVSYVTDEYRGRARQNALRRGLGKGFKGKRLSHEHIEKIRQAHIGHSRGGWSMSEEICKARSDRSKKGADSPLWKGGTTKENAIARSSHEYRVWRRAVFKRDKRTCQIYGTKEGPLEADHIKPFAYFKELRFDVSNGRVLCVPCHKKTPTYLSGAQLMYKHLKEV